MTQTAPHTSRYRWVMLTLLWLLYFSFGMITRSPSPLVSPILRDLGITFSQMGLVLGSWQMTYIVLAALAGVVMDRWGIRRSIFFGALVIGLSAILRSLSTGFVTLLIFVALFGAGGPMISIGCPKAIARWFHGKERGTAVGIYSTGPWIGGMFSLAATNSLVMPMTGYSWRLTFVCYGSLALLLALLWWRLAKEPDAGPGTDRFDLFRVFSDFFRITPVRILLLSGLLCFGLMHGFANWLPKILETHGMSPEKAGYAAALPYITSIPAVLMLPRLIPAAARPRWIALFGVLTGAAVLWVAAIQGPPMGGLLLFGASGSCLFPLLVLTLMDTPAVDPQVLGSAAGVFFGIAEIGGFFGPFVVGTLVDLTGTFSAGAAFLAGLGGLVAILMLPLARALRLQTPPSASV